MSEHSKEQALAGGNVVAFDGTGQDADYWYGLIAEEAAAAFCNLKPRSMQNYRQKGGGAKYISISSRCIKYRRIDLKAWADARVRTSTADAGTDSPGAEAA